MAAPPVPPSQEAGTKSTITIEELTGRSGLKPRVLILSGGGLPFMGATWGSELRMKTTWYAGNAAEATQQILVPVEMPSQWEGMWKRTLLKDTPAWFADETGVASQIVDPFALRLLVEDMQRMGAALRVTWAVTGRGVIGDPDPRFAQMRSIDDRIVRIGRITQFVTPIDRNTDIRWQATFEWKSRGASSVRVANVDGQSSANAAARAFAASVAASVDAVNNRKFIQSNQDKRLSATRLTLGQLETIAALPKKTVDLYARKLQVAVNDFKRVGEIAEKVRTTPAAISNSIIDFSRNTLFVINEFVDRTGRTPPEVMSNKSKVADLLRAWNYTQSISDQAQLNGRAALNLIDVVKRTQGVGSLQGALSVRETTASRPKDVLAIHVTREGDTPQKLSLRYFKNPDRGVDILQANRLPWHITSFERGKIIIIPTLSSGGANV